MLTRRLPALLFSTALFFLPAVLHAQETGAKDPAPQPVDQVGGMDTGTAAPVPGDVPEKQVEEHKPDANPALQAPTIGGATGLFRLVTGDIGTRHTFRIRY